MGTEYNYNIKMTHNDSKDTNCNNIEGNILQLHKRINNEKPIDNDNT